ncbi:4-alpha-glucanotransferase [Labedaea rhizosphaerae]|uniref:4-alpha-glucanotransferase n=1 Tax=Labedaea rhizosphaerae TaxID=598644 RepID=A0A4R6S4B3_LABRH|nr:4-alpha-glucanotransferase [Labedaea rhizosphaerae]TDP93927.1 4-alpha-glucanotransferase [Labedaea rhizosphaerae]
MHAELAELAAAHGVATSYENADRVEVTVDEDVVIAILAQLDVDASTPSAVRAALAELRSAPDALPPTVVVREGATRPLDGPAEITLEDGTTRAVTAIPDDLPLGWHRLRTDTQEVTLVVVPQRLPAVPRAWGWMLQLYAMRSAESWGMGDFGDLASIAEHSGAGVVLVNPVRAVSPTHPVERSPYSPASRRFLNPLYLRITDTAAFGRADEATRAAVVALRPPSSELIDYDSVWAAKRSALELLWPFAERVDPAPDLRDFATFCALAEQHGPDWRSWPASEQDPASASAPEERVAFHVWLQQECLAQLAAVQDRSRMAVGVIHDLPVGVHPGGADTWAARDAFAADVRVGAPPDAFSQQGQDWNLPPWRPDRLARLGYAPLRDMLRSVLTHADGVRIDHVAGLWRLWWIPPGEPASRGTYVHYDAEAMIGIAALEAHRAGAVVVGEDLGTVQPTVTTTLHERGMLSSAVLWFQRNWVRPGQPFVPPREWTEQAMASVSTHDLPTVTGWLEAEHVRIRSALGLLTDSDAAEYERAAAERSAMTALLRAEGIPTDDMVLALHKLLGTAASQLVLTSPADVVGQVRQPNLPGTVDQYPNWRIPLPLTLEEFLADPRVRTIAAALSEHH